MKVRLTFLFVFFHCLSIQAQSNFSEKDSIAQQLVREGQYKKALQLVVESKTLAEKEQQDSFLVHFKNREAVIYHRLGDYEKAHELYLQVQKDREKLYGTEHLLYSKILNNLGALAMELGQNKEALQYLEKALAIRAKLYGYEHIEYGKSLMNIAGVYNNLEKYDAAEIALLEVKKIIEQQFGKNNPYYANCITNLASIYERLQRYTDAILMNKEALNFIETNYGKSNIEYARYLTRLASCFFFTEKKDMAEETYLEATQIMKAVVGENHQEYGTSLANLSSFYIQNKDYQKALSLSNRTIQSFKNSLGDRHPQTIAAELNDLQIKTHLEYPNLTEAYSALQDKILQNESEYSDHYIRLLNMLAEYQLNQGEKSKSYATIYQAARLNFPDLKIQEASWEKDLLSASWDNTFIKSFKDCWVIFYNWRYYLKSIDAPNEKIHKINLLELKIRTFWRQNFSNTSDKKSILAQNAPITSYTLNNLEPLIHSNTNQNYWNDALSVMEYNKSALLQESLQASQLAHMGNLPDSLVKIGSDLKAEIEQNRKLVIESVLNANDSAKTQAEAALSSSNLKYQTHLNYLKEKYQNYYKLLHQQKEIDISQLQAVLKKDQLLISFSYTATDSLLWMFICGKDFKEFKELPITAANLKKRVKRLRRTLSDYEFLAKEEETALQIYLEEAYWFYEQLLKSSLAKNPESKHLIIIPDRELGHIPFEAFLSEASKTSNYRELPYLIKSYRISYNYSVNLWLDNREKLDRAYSKQLLACAASYSSDTDSSATRSLRAPHLRNLRDVLIELPAAKEEVNKLSKLFDATAWQAEATNEAAFKAHAGDYQVIHLAMHGLLNTQYPILSSLAFTENNDTTEDNFLQAYEISQMELNAELVVLSACETGYGKFEQGEGVMSLARSFMYAGVPSLVVSLWQVNDMSTSIIMEEFYRELAKGHDKAKALQQAKITFIDRADGIAAHPAFWAPFIQLGDSRPVLLAQPSSWLSWLWGLGIPLVLIIGFWLVLRKKKEKQA